MASDLVLNPRQELPLGSSEWADPDALWIGKYKPGVFYLSSQDENKNNILGKLDDGHVMCIGGTRSGKGISTLINNLLLWLGSVVVIDPKGEAINVTGRARANGSAYCVGKKQKVYLLDPQEVAGRVDDNFDDLRACHNPLDEIDVHSDKALDQISALAAALVPDASHGDPYWVNAARALLKMIILYVLISDAFEDHERNLVTVYRLLAMGDQEKREFLKAIEAEGIPSAHFLLFKGMEACKEFGGMISAAGAQYADMAKEAPKQFLGVIETLNRNLEFIQSPGMQRCLSKSDFSLKELKDNPNGVSLYLCLPNWAMEEHYRWLRLMVTMCTLTFESQSYQPRSGSPVMTMLDEFPSLKRMPAIENGVAQLAGFGVKFVFAVQTLAQLKTLYKDNYETFIGNCSTKVFLSIEDHMTRDYASKLIGDTEVVRISNTLSTARNTSKAVAETTGFSTSSGRSTSFGSGPGGNNHSFTTQSNSSHSESFTVTNTQGITESEGTNESIQKRRLIAPEEVGRYFTYRGPDDPGHILVLIAGDMPYILPRCPYFRHVEFAGRFDPHPDYPYPPTLHQRIDLRFRLVDEETNRINKKFLEDQLQMRKAFQEEEAKRKKAQLAQLEVQRQKRFQKRIKLFLLTAFMLIVPGAIGLGFIGYAAKRLTVAKSFTVEKALNGAMSFPVTQPHKWVHFINDGYVWLTASLGTLFIILMLFEVLRGGKSS